MTPHPHAYPARHTSHPLGPELLDERFGPPPDVERVGQPLPAWTEHDQARHRAVLLEALKR